MINMHGIGRREYRHGFAMTLVTVRSQQLSAGFLRLDVTWGRIKGWRTQDGRAPSLAQRVRWGGAQVSSETWAAGPPTYRAWPWGRGGKGCDGGVRM